MIGHTQPISFVHKTAGTLVTQAALLLFTHHSYRTGVWSKWEARGLRRRRPYSSPTWSTLMAWVWRSCCSTPSRQPTWTLDPNSTNTLCCRADPPCTRVFPPASNVKSSSCIWRECSEATLQGFQWVVDVILQHLIWSDQLLGEQTDIDFTVGQCLVSDENSACWISARHNTLSDGDVKVCLSYGSAL